MKRGMSNQGILDNWNGIKIGFGLKPREIKFSQNGSKQDCLPWYWDGICSIWLNFDAYCAAQAEKQLILVE